MRSQKPRRMPHAGARPAKYPHMLMNPYDLGDLFGLVRLRGCAGTYCMLVDQGRYPGAIVIAQAPASEASR
jgi:hypothetical protein